MATGDDVDGHRGPERHVHPTLVSRRRRPSARCGKLRARGVGVAMVVFLLVVLVAIVLGIIGAVGSGVGAANTNP